VFHVLQGHFYIVPYLYYIVVPKSTRLIFTALFIYSLYITDIQFLTLCLGISHEILGTKGTYCTRARNSKISNVGRHVDRRSFPEAVAPVVAVKAVFACAEGQHV